VLSLAAWQQEIGSMCLLAGQLVEVMVAGAGHQLTTDHWPVVTID